MEYLTAIDDCFLDHPSGSARVAWDIAEAMKRNGHSVTMVCKNLSADDSGVRVTYEGGIRLIRIPWAGAGRWSPSRFRATIELERTGIAETIGNESIDILHVHLPLIGTAAADCFPNSRRTVYTMHSPAAQEMGFTWRSAGLGGRIRALIGLPQLKRIERQILSRCDMIHTLSAYTRKELLASHPGGWPVTVLPHWGRPESARRHTVAEARAILGWPPDEKILFTVRKHIPRTGLSVAIDAIAPLAAEGRCMFVVGGDGYLRSELIGQAKRYGASDYQVRFVGRLSEVELQLAYEAADLFVLPTLALECFGIILIEAMAVGCPVVASNVAAIPEVVAGITPDLLVPAGDATALRRKIEQFLNGKLPVPTPLELSEYIERNYSAAQVVPRIVGLLTGSQVLCG